jgi:signal transduction histidine kinase
MLNTAESRLKRTKEIIHNPHFWGIIFIILALTSIYYIGILFVNIFDPTWEWLWRLLVFEYVNNLHGSLFCIPFIYAAVIFWWRGILITWLFSIALILPRIYYYSPDNIYLIINIIFLLIPLLIVIILALQRKWRETERKALIEKEIERQAYIAEIIKVQEDERQRISREIHDDTTQRLWILANQVKKLASDKLRNIAPEIVAELEKITDTILGISNDTRRLSIALRPGILDDLGPIHAIRWLVDQMNNENSIEAKFVLVDGHHRQLNHEIGTHLFRITQEALNNVRRHSGATQVFLKLRFKPETVEMEIRDNGKGFSFRDISEFSNQKKLGIIGIQERVRLLAGVLKIDSKRGKGTSISVELKDTAYPSVDS